MERKKNKIYSKEKAGQIRFNAIFLAFLTLCTIILLNSSIVALGNISDNNTVNVSDDQISPEKNSTAQDLKINLLSEVKGNPTAQNNPSITGVVIVSDSQILNENNASSQAQLYFRSKRPTPAEREAAAERFKATYYGSIEAPSLAQNIIPSLDPGGIPHYFGPYANWAYSPLPKGAITRINVTNGGNRYTAPAVIISDAYNTGSGASATPTVAGGIITGIKVNSMGGGYTAPLITIIDTGTGKGAGATAVASIENTTSSVSGGIRKFIDRLPGLNANGKNNLGQYIPIAVPDRTTYPGYDYYEIALVQFSEKMHSDLPRTTLRGYVQIETTTNRATSMHVPLNYPNGTAILNTTTGLQVFAHNDTQYLGPAISAQKGRPVRVKFHNYLPTGSRGDLFIPIDTSVMGSGMGPNMVMAAAANSVGTMATIRTMNPHSFKIGQRVMLMDFKPSAYDGTFDVIGVPNATSFNVILKSSPGRATTVGSIAEMYRQNRATVHLHGGDTVWISDGTPHQWTTPAKDNTNYPEGVSVQNVPDMDNGYEPQGTLTFFYTNNQSARLMFYHDHSYGITRLNVYSGQAGPYLLTDQVEKDLIEGTDKTGVNPSHAKPLIDSGIPLVIQDKTFVDNTTIASQDPTWNWGTGSKNSNGNISKAITGDLWYPHVYMTNQNPWDITGTNAFGRWMYSPWFWPPATPLHGLIPNPYYTGGAGTSKPWEPPMIPGTPNPSMAMESFMDTPVVNGAVYPILTLDPKPYRFRILNAANERFFNLQLYNASSTIDNITVENGGTGYTAPVITITDTGTGKGIGATAQATVAGGIITGITLLTVGSNYTAPQVIIKDPNPAATGANAKAHVYKKLTEVGMVPASPGLNPANWPTDGRDGGVPDPATIGPSFIQIGSEGGFLPAPAVVENQPITWNGNMQAFNFGNVDKHALLLGPAERADVIIDFSAYSGKTLILYNDAPAAFPAPDPRVDYYTNDLNQIDTGGAPTTMPGYGPNTRTVMQIRINDIPSTGRYDISTLNSVFANTTGKQGVFNASQPKIIIPQSAYDTAYNKIFATDVTQEYIQLFENAHTFKNISGTTLSIPLEPKSIHDEMNAAYDTEYGRMSGILGLESQNTNPLTQNFMLYPYASPPVEIIKDCVVPMSEPAAGDGTQIWRITHNGVDDHTYHFHLYNVQLINRVAWDGILIPPDANELGWKETVRVNPLEHTIVALRPVAPWVPFKVPNSTRLIDPTMPAGAILMGPPGGFADPAGNPITVINHLVNFGWEYVIHCHLLAHEEMDMMHAQAFAVAPEAPTGLSARTGSPVTLTWTDNSISETGSEIQRAKDAGFKTELNTFTVGPNVTKYTDTTAIAGIHYYYRLCAISTVGDSGVYVAPSIGFPQKTVNSAFSNTIAVTPLLIVAPSKLSATINANPLQIRLTWTDASNNELNFAIWRSDNGGAFTQVGTIPRTSTQSKQTGGTISFSDGNFIVGHTYQYYVIAVNGQSWSAPSSIVTVPMLVPAAPTVLSGTVSNRNRVTLTWIDNANNENGFQIQRYGNVAFTAPATFTAGVNAVTLSQTVTPRNTYYYRILAYNAVGTSGWSNVVQVIVP